MPGQTIGRLLLGEQLEALRAAAHVTRDQAARAVGDRTDIRIRHWEAGRRVPKFEAVVLLGQLYGVDETVIDALQVMRQDANKPSRYAVFGLLENAKTYMGLEEDAVDVRTVEHVVVPGLLQVEAYMRRVFMLSGQTPQIVNKYVAARLQRQERLVADDPLKLTAVISEAALLWAANEPDVGVAQLEHLAEQAQRPNIDIHVIRFDGGLHPCMDGAFALLRFPVGLFPDVAYVEDVGGGHLVDSASTVAELDTMFGELHSRTLGANESLALIAQLADKSRK